MQTPKAKLLPVQAGDAVVCALSGGADSVCMTALVQQCPGLLVTAAHFNHGLRGAESDGDEAFVRGFCKARQLPLTVGRASVAQAAKVAGEGLEEAGRRLRYAFLEETAQTLAAQTGKRVWILTAHTANDQAETLLFRLARGSGGAGLCAIPYRRGRILRPILHLTRQEVEDYCQSRGLSYVTDSSNADPAFARNRIRGEVLPVLTALNAGAVRHLAQGAALLAEENAYLEGEAAALLSRAQREGGFCAKTLADAPGVLKNRALGLLLRQAGCALTRERVARLAGLLERPYARTQVEGVRFLHTRGMLRWEKIPPKAAPFVPVALTPGQAVFTPSGKVLKIQILDTTDSDTVHNFYKNSFYPAWDCAKIKGIPILRTRMPGDAIRLAGRGCTKTLKKLFAEAALPLEERDRRWVLADDRGVFAVEGFGLDERVVCTKDTARAMRLLLADIKEKEG